MGDENTEHTEDAAQVTAIRNAIDSIDLSGSFSGPLKRAVDDLLGLAAASVGSADASVLVRDGNEGGLRFLLAVSELEDKLLKLRLPPGKGIAGLVFSSGQPMAVNDVSEEGSFWSKADQETGFKTITLLATPLRTGNETIGVLEFVNRPGDPPYPPFTPEEMDRAAYFADAIARLVDAYELAALIESVFTHAIHLPGGPEESGERERGLRDWLEISEAAPEHRDLMYLTIALREVVTRGKAERDLCRDLLDTIARYTEKHSSSSSSYFSF